MKGAASCEARETNPAPPGDDEGSQGRRSNATWFRASSADLEVRLSAFTARAGPWQHHGGGSPPGLPGRFLLLQLRVKKSLDGMRHVPCSTIWDTRCSSPSPKRASGRQAMTRLPVIPARFQHGVLRPPTRRGQSVARPRRRSGGHDMKRPRVWWCPERVTPPRWPSSGCVRLGGRSRRG